MELIEQLILPNLEYSELELSSIMDVLKVRNQINTYLQKEESKVDNEKHKLIEEGFTEKWGITLKDLQISNIDDIPKQDKDEIIKKMLPLKSNELKRIQKILGLANFQLVDQTTSMFQLQGRKYLTNISQFCREKGHALLEVFYG